VWEPIWLAEGHGSLLQIKQPGPGALERDAFVDEGVHDLVERHLAIGERFHAGQAGTEDVSAADGAADRLAAFLVAVVEVTEFLAAQGGRAAGDTVRLGVVADTDGHGSLQKSNQQLAISN
jgi:hypothetical protein